MATESSVMMVLRAARPTFRNANDRVAFALHAAFLAAGFSLTATGPQALADNPPIGGDEVGTDGWNEAEDAYAFVYTKTGKGMMKNVWVKCLAIGDALMVDALSLEEQKEPLHLEINVKEFVSDDGDHSRNYVAMYKNFKDLVNNFNAGLLTKLEPKVESSTAAQSSRRSERSVNEPVVGVPAEPLLPHPSFVCPPISSSGSSDLFPGPGAGFYPERGPGIGNMGGGMLVGPNDPRFFVSGEQPGFFGGLAGVPPGARFDPIGPPNVPGFERGRFVRQPRQSRGGGTHPDLEHFQGSDFI